MKASWDDHRFFLAIARAGSLTGAAKALSVSQPTVSRRLDAMETRIGTRLFHRTRKGYEMTPSGAELFETVVRVEEELAEAGRIVFDRDRDLSGSLRVTSTEIFVNGYLGQHIWAFLRTHTDIEIQLICTQSTLSLSRGEADIAIRFTETPPDTLVGRRLATVAYGIYSASDNSGDRFIPAERADWEWIGMHNETHNRMLYGTFSPRTRLKHRVDNMAAMHAMVRAGLGVSILPCYTADRDPGLRRLNPEPLLDPKFDMWVLYHPDVRRTHRLRVFAEFIADRIGGDVDLFEGRRPREG
ncbi:MAG: LysR family transcriptional regulator [Paracoccaceae bacterium]|nr:LysR family transcriptional regulator [Paracoccaceae bacterium]